MLQILKDEKYPTTEERLLKYATDSFQRLLPKLQIQVNVKYVNALIYSF